MGAIVRTALRGAQAHVRLVSPVRPGAAGELVGRVYAQVERDFGMLAPPVSLHSPAPECLAASWMTLRETLLAGRVDRAAKEAVAAAVSLGNSCPYCVDVHSATLFGLVRARDAAAVAGDRLDEVADPRVRAVAVWARASGTRERAELAGAPVPAREAPQVIGTAVTFHYLNRMVNVFLAESPLPPAVPAAARGGALRLFGRVMRPAARRGFPSGDALDLLPAAPLPADLGWAAGDGSVAGAFARAAAAIEAAGARSVPAPVRELVAARLDAWDGRPPGLSRSWLEDAVAGLGAADRPAGRLALLTAVASYQVDGAVVDAFRADRPDDRALVELTSWASFAAARRVGRWLRAGAAGAAA